jgi:hypothetical protein
MGYSLSRHDEFQAAYRRKQGPTLPELFPESRTIIRIRVILFDSDGAERTGIDDSPVFFRDELLMIDYPWPVIPHLKKHREKFRTGRAAYAKTIIYIGYQEALVLSISIDLIITDTL